MLTVTCTEREKSQGDYNSYNEKSCQFLMLGLRNNHSYMRMFFQVFSGKDRQQKGKWHVQNLTNYRMVSEFLDTDYFIED